MKHVFTLITLVLVLSCGLAQTPVFTDFVTGTAQAKNGQVEFYLQNISSCMLEEIQVRVSHNNVYSSADAATFITRLQPNAQGTFVMRLTDVVSEGWAWTIDSVMLAQPEAATCQHLGLVAFEKVDFAGVAKPSSETTVASPAAEITRAVTRDYTVIAGDSWWKLAERFDSTPEVIAQLNGRSTNELTIGEIIKVPAPTLEASQTEPAQIETIQPETETSSGSVASGSTPINSEDQQLTAYTVKAGDTLFGIARTFETTIGLIRQANCLKEDVLSVNQALQIPPKDAALTNVCN
jgi:LysM repeat protein